MTPAQLSWMYLEQKRTEAQKKPAASKPQTTPTPLAKLLKLLIRGEG